MKRIKLIGLCGVIGLITVAAVNAKRMVIYLGLLQSDLDANGFSITNAVTFRGSNFVYEGSGVAILNDATNNDLRLGLSATNEALLIGARATNNDTVTSNGVFAAAQAMTNAHGLHVDASNVLSGGVIASAALSGRTMTNLTAKSAAAGTYFAFTIADATGGSEVDFRVDPGTGGNSGVELDSSSSPFDVPIKLNSTGIVAKAFSGALNADNLSSGTVASARFPYKIYRALLSQSGTAAPVATVLENTLGFTPTFTRSTFGNYEIHSSSGFTSGKTFIVHGDCPGTGGSGIVTVMVVWSNSSVISIVSNSADVSAPGASDADDLLSKTSVEILIYP